MSKIDLNQISSYLEMSYIIRVKVLILYAIEKSPTPG